MTHRRHFLAQLSLGAAGFAVSRAELRASTAQPPGGRWDTSWIPKVEAAKYRVVFNASDIAEGASLYYAETFFNNFHEAHGTTDAETRPVIVARSMGTPLAVNDAMWRAYRLGEETKTTDPGTKQPALRNVYWSAPGGGESAATTIETLQQRGLIVLVCNVALGGLGYRLAKRDNRKPEDVQAELRANLVPGAIPVPSGIYALIRAQNAGCAFMPGT